MIKFLFATSVIHFIFNLGIFVMMLEKEEVWDFLCINTKLLFLYTPLPLWISRSILLSFTVIVTHKQSSKKTFTFSSKSQKIICKIKIFNNSSVENYMYSQIEYSFIYLYLNVMVWIKFVRNIFSGVFKTFETCISSEICIFQQYFKLTPGGKLMN